MFKKIFSLLILFFIICLCEVTNGKIEPILLIHGGAGDISDERVPLKFNGMKKAVDRGYKALYFGGSVLDAVEAAVMTMEDDTAFNAGHGAVLNLDGEVEMDASIQRGSDLAVGCATLIQDFKNPISIARKILEKTPHNMLGGKGAKRFAISQGFEVINPQSLVTQDALDALNQFLRNETENSRKLGAGRKQSKIEAGVGTVGAVAVDSEGRIAVATSTGGISGKYVGRIGDTPIIGGGTYADDKVGGVSCTGHGESIMKISLAHTIIKHMENGLSAQKATELALDYMEKRLNNTAGAITLSNQGDIGIYFTSNRMAWSYIKSNKIYWGINKKELNEEFYSPFG